MSLSELTTGDVTASSQRTKINAAISQVNTNTTSIIANTSAIGAEATARANAISAAEDDLDTAAANSRWRPGDNPRLFTGSLNGAPEDCTPLDANRAQASASGRAWRMVGQETVATREPFPCDPGSVWRVTWLLTRFATPADEGAAVKFGVHGLTGAYAAQGTDQIVANDAPIAPAGMSAVIYVNGTGDDSVDYPSGAVFWRPYIDTYGADDGASLAYEIRVEKVSDPDAAALDATAIGARLTTAEGEIATIMAAGGALGYATLDGSGHLINSQLSIGADKQIIWNNAGTISGLSALTWDDSAKTLGVLGVQTLNVDGATFQARNSSVTAHDIYGPLDPDGWFNVDGIRSVMSVPNTFTAINMSAFGGYVRNQVASGGLSKNAVVNFGVITAEVNGAASWGANYAVIDGSSGSATGSGSGRQLVGIEFDMIGTQTGTIMQGVSCINASTVSIVGSDAYSVGVGAEGYWTHAFVVNDACADVGLYLGSHTHLSPDSAPIRFGWYDGGGTGHAIDLKAVFGGLGVNDPLLANGIAFVPAATGQTPVIVAQGSDTNINLSLQAKNTGSIIFNSPVGLPTSDPHVAGKLWSNSGIVTQSAG